MNKKHIFYFGFALATIIGLQSCETPREVIVEKPIEIAFKNIASGYLTGNGSEGVSEGGVVINSQEEWDALTINMNYVNNAIDEQSIDFNKMTVLAFFDQIRGSGGYSVEFVSILKTGNTIQAQIKKTAPKEDAIEIMTQPYNIVFIEKSNNIIKFIN